MEVHVLEHWVKTDHGWLPVHDTRGKLLLQPAGQEEGHSAGAAMAICRERREKKVKEGGDALQPGEEAAIRHFGSIQNIFGRFCWLLKAFHDFKWPLTWRPGLAGPLRTPLGTLPHA